MQTTTVRNRAFDLDSRISKTLSNTFLTVTGLWVLFAAGGGMALHSHFSLVANIGFFIAAILLMFATFAMRNSGWGLVTLGAFAGIQGIASGPLLQHYLGLSNGPQLVLTAAGLTAGTTLGLAIYAMTTKKSFSYLKGILFAGLIGLLVLSLIGLFVQMPMFHLMLSVFSAILFTAYLLMNISEVVTGEQTNYIIAALNIFLDMLNIFSSIMRIGGSAD